MLARRVRDRIVPGPLHHTVLSGRAWLAPFQSSCWLTVLFTSGYFSCHLLSHQGRMKNSSAVGAWDIWPGSREVASGLLCHMIMEFCLYLGTRKGTSKKSTRYKHLWWGFVCFVLCLVPMSKNRVSLQLPCPCTHSTDVLHYRHNAVWHEAHLISVH